MYVCAFSRHYSFFFRVPLKNALVRAPGVRVPKVGNHCPIILRSVRKLLNARTSRTIAIRLCILHEVALEHV